MWHSLWDMASVSSPKEFSGLYYYVLLYLPGKGNERKCCRNIYRKGNARNERGGILKVKRLPWSTVDAGTVVLLTKEGRKEEWRESLGSY